MKRSISAIVALCLLFTMFVPFVSADNTQDTVSVTSVLYTSLNDIYTLTVNGICKSGTKISVVVKNAEGSVRAMEQCKAEEGDTFSKTFKINVSSDKLSVSEGDPIVETVYVRSYRNASDSYEVPLYSEADRIKIINEKFNNASSSAEMLGLINSYYKVFGFDMTYFNAMDEETAEFMLSEKDFSVSDINEKFSKSVIRAYLFNESYTADRTAVIEYPPYDAIHGITSGFGTAESLYGDYKTMTDVQKSSVNKRAFKPENKTAEFTTLKEYFFMAVTAQIFADNSENYAVIYNFLKSHNDWFALKDLEILTTYKVSQVIGKLAGQQIPSTKEEFVADYNSILGTNIPTTPENPSTGGSGGGGGTVKVPSDETTYNPPSKDDTNLPSNTLSQGAGFSDLGGYGWASGAINALAKLNVVNGKGNNLFAPGDPITREEFAKILVLAFGLYNESAECNFADVSPERWSYKYIANVYRCGAVTGYADGTFGSSKPITREEMSVMIYRVLNSKNMIDTEKGAYADFNDADSISDFALNAVIMLAGNGIVSGSSDGNFNPKNGASRAEACKMIYNSISSKGGNE